MLEASCENLKRKKGPLFTMPPIVLWRKLRILTASQTHGNSPGPAREEISYNFHILTPSFIERMQMSGGIYAETGAVQTG